MNREKTIDQARILWDGTRLQDNPEYLRGMCELIAYCFPISDVDTETNVALIQEAVTSQGNLNISPDKWLKEMFEYEYCAECGGDAQHHTAVPLLGNWFARCDFPANEEGEYHPEITKYRREKA